MSMYGRSVSEPGIHWNLSVTSWSGFSEVLSMTYTGRAAKIPSSVSTMRRVHTNDIGRAIGDRCALDIAPPRPGGDGQVRRGHQEQEEQQQHGHGRAGAEVPGEERRLVDVDGDQVAGGGRRLPEQDVRDVEVVERPQEEHEDEHLVDRAQRRHRDVADLLPDARAVDGRGLVHL